MYPLYELPQGLSLDDPPSNNTAKLVKWDVEPHIWPSLEEIHLSSHFHFGGLTDSSRYPRQLFLFNFDSSVLMQISASPENGISFPNSSIAITFNTGDTTFGFVESSPSCATIENISSLASASTEPIIVPSENTLTWNWLIVDAVIVVIGDTGIWNICGVGDTEIGIFSGSGGSMYASLFEEVGVGEDTIEFVLDTLIDIVDDSVGENVENLDIDILDDIVMELVVDGTGVKDSEIDLVMLLVTEGDVRKEREEVGEWDTDLVALLVVDVDLVALFVADVDFDGEAVVEVVTVADLVAESEGESVEDGESVCDDVGVFVGVIDKLIDLVGVFDSDNDGVIEPVCVLVGDTLGVGVLVGLVGSP